MRNQWSVAARGVLSVLLVIAIFVGSVSFVATDSTQSSTAHPKGMQTLLFGPISTAQVTWLQGKFAPTHPTIALSSDLTEEVKTRPIEKVIHFMSQTMGKYYKNDNH